MKIFTIFCILVLIILQSSVFAAEVREIVLNDGSIIYGKVISLNNGTFTINCEDVGTLKIEESKVRSIRSMSQGIEAASQTATGELSSSTVKAGVKALKMTMKSNEAIMQSISNLQYDPAFKDILNDPAILSAVESGDIKTLMSNPKFLRILHHPTVGQIERNLE